jgi:CO dehydrogenase/acetyl-CoA synthase epsilon subunit
LVKYNELSWDEWKTGLTGPVHFDLFGCLYYYISKMFQRGKKEILLDFLVKLLKHDHIVVVMDG